MHHMILKNSNTKVSHIQHNALYFYWNNYLLLVNFNLSKATTPWLTQYFPDDGESPWMKVLGSGGGSPAPATIHWELKFRNKIFNIVVSCVLFNIAKEALEEVNTENSKSYVKKNVIISLKYHTCDKHICISYHHKAPNLEIAHTSYLDWDRKRESLMSETFAWKIRKRQKKSCFCRKRQQILRFGNKRESSFPS